MHLGDAVDSILLSALNYSKWCCLLDDLNSFSSRIFFSRRRDELTCPGQGLTSRVQPYGQLVSLVYLLFHETSIHSIETHLWITR